MESTWSVALALATFLCRAAITWAVECESYYVPFSAHDNCLYLTSGSRTWDLAHENCAAYGNTLINIDSPEAAQELRNILASKFPSITEIWTGLKDHWQEGQYRWSRGELQTDTTIFAAGEPSDNSRSQNCMSAKHATGAWAWRMWDRSCMNTLLPHVCENWPNDKKKRGGTFSRQHNVTEANMNLEVKASLQGSFRFCSESCLASPYCEVLAVNTASKQCKILFFKEQALATRQSLLTQLAAYKIYLRSSFDKHY